MALTFETELKEIELSGLLGVSRREVTKVRKGLPKSMWRHGTPGVQRDGSIWITKEGCAEIVRILNGNEEVPVEAQITKESVGKEDAVEVVRAFSGQGNWRMLLCKWTDGRGEVWVRTNARLPEHAVLYRPGMRFNVRWDGTVWNQDGRVPRGYGRL